MKQTPRSDKRPAFSSAFWLPSSRSEMARVKSGSPFINEEELFTAIADIVKDPAVGWLVRGQYLEKLAEIASEKEVRPLIDLLKADANNSRYQSSIKRAEEKLTKN